jgi:hypothetical protein
MRQDLKLLAHLLVSTFLLFSAVADAGAAPVSKAGTPGLTIKVVTLAAGRLVITGSAAAAGVVVTIQGTRFAARANAQKLFSFNVLHRTPDCLVTLVTSTGSLRLTISDCGPQGPIGPAGPRGLQGIKGLTGASGPAGPPGTAGIRGPIGPPGPAGVEGERGIAGPPGAAGATGPKGPAGPSGPAGPAGPQGERGIAGAPGAVGPQGLAGSAGPTGPEGPRGVAGMSGPIGPQGPTGAQGPRGLAGASGAQGPTGPTGPAGPAGPEGPQGPRGEQGLAGAFADSISRTTVCSAAIAGSYVLISGFYYCSAVCDADETALTGHYQKRSGTTSALLEDRQVVPIYGQHALITGRSGYTADPRYPPNLPSFKEAITLVCTPRLSF